MSHLQRPTLGDYNQSQEEGKTAVLSITKSDSSSRKLINPQLKNKIVFSHKVVMPSQTSKKFNHDKSIIVDKSIYSSNYRLETNKICESGRYRHEACPAFRVACKKVQLFYNKQVAFIQHYQNKVQQTAEVFFKPLFEQDVSEGAIKRQEEGAF